MHSIFTIRTSEISLNILLTCKIRFTSVCLVAVVSCPTKAVVSCMRLLKKEDLKPFKNYLVKVASETIRNIK